MSTTAVDLARTRDLLGRYVSECPWFWELNTDKRQCAKLWRHMEAIEEAYGLPPEAALDEVVELGRSRLADRPATVYVSGRGGSGSHWLADMLGDLGGFANAGEVSIPRRFALEIAPWPLEEQGLVVDCVQLLHAWAGAPYPDVPAVVRPDVARMHIVNSNGDTSLLQFKQWEPNCVFVHLIRDPREQVMSFTYRKPGSRANYPIEPLDDFLRLMLIYNRVSLMQVVVAPIAPDLVCRYEDLRVDPTPELRKIVDRVGIKVADQTIQEVAFRHSAEARRQGIGAPLGNLSLKPPRTWRETASRTEKLLMHAGLAEVVDTLGYELDDCAGERLDFLPLTEDVELTVPDGFVLGELHVRRSAEDIWQRDGHAAGTFVLRAGSMARLRAPGAWTTGLDQLTELLPADAVASLCLAGNTDITDDFVKDLARWRGLVELDLARTRVTDRSVDVISQMHGLRHLSVAGSGVSRGAVERLQRELADCSVSDAPLITDEIRGRRLFNEQLVTEPPQ